MSVALPKYFFPAVFASAFKPAVELGVVAPVVLVGVLVLQAGQWYAEWKEFEDSEKEEKETRERSAGGSKKKQ